MQDLDKRINWFPGHMKKTIEEFRKELNLIDLVIEIVDSRAINISSNSEILNIVKEKNKKIIKVALKSDLADIDVNDPLIGNIYNDKFRKVIINAISNSLKEKINNFLKKGYTNPKVYVAVVGLPNIGKSSFINFLLNKKNLIAKNEPGVTRKKNWVKLTNNIFLLDTPGVLFKKISDLKVGYILTLLRTIKWDVVDKYQTIKFAYEFYLDKYEKEIFAFYDLTSKLSFDNFLIFFAKKDGFLLKNNEYNIDLCLEKLYSDFSNSKICKVNYEK